MKVGDVVKQHGNSIRGVKEGYNKKVSPRLGVVIKITEIPDEAPEHVKRNMKSLTGRLVTVMWDSGVVHENFAEKMLEVVIESD